MNNPSHDFVTVEMRGLKAALVVLAQTQRVSDVRAHLTLTARVLAELQPHRVKRDEPRHPSS